MRVLIAEDEVVARRTLESLLTEWGYDTKTVEDGASAWEVLRDVDAPRMAILDWVMPGMTGVEVCRRVRQRPGGEYVYLLLLTARSRKEDIVAGMDAGADDYLVKPFEQEELRVRLRAARRVLDLQARLLAAQAALREQASRDALTGLLNRATVMEMLHRELADAVRLERPLSVVLGDIDHFKRVNDTYGHPAGDAVLREVGRLLPRFLRTHDCVGRYGGEEFLLVLPGSDSCGATWASNRLRRAIADTVVETAAGQLQVTMSLGVAATEDVDPVSEQALIQAADDALYRAKEEGRNCVRRAGEEGEEGGMDATS